MGDLKYLLPILVAVVLVWITYLIINFVATIIKTKKKDDTMVCGVNIQGKVFYGVLVVIYLVMFVYCVYFMITHLLSGDVDSVYLPLNILTIYSFVFYLIIIIFGFPSNKKAISIEIAFYLVLCNDFLRIESSIKRIYVSNVFCP